LGGYLSWERLDLEGELELRERLQKWGEPAICDFTWVAADRERPLPALADADAIGA
jgi:hypothetical protein